jgi:hypothetical protein
MSISTYAELKTAVGSWLQRADSDNYVDDLILVAESWIYRKVRAREMETSMSVTVTNNLGTLPAGFIENKYAIWNTTPQVSLKPKPAQWIEETYPQTTSASIPQYIGVVGSNFILGPRASGGTITGTYYKNLGSVSSTAHDLFLNNPDLYLFAALAEAMSFLKNDARIAVWEAKRNNIAADVNSQAQQSRFSDAMSISVA